MINLKHTLLVLLSDESGQDLIEYALVRRSLPWVPRLQ